MINRCFRLVPYIATQSVDFIVQPHLSVAETGRTVMITGTFMYYSRKYQHLILWFVLHFIMVVIRDCNRELSLNG